MISYTVQGRGVLESPLAENGLIHRRLTIEPGNNSIELVVANPASDFQFQGRANKASYRVTDKNEMVLTILASDNPINLNLVLGSKGKQVTDMVTDLTELTKGGSRRWTSTHAMKGKQAVSTFQGYALDSIPVPLKNAYNT